MKKVLIAVAVVFTLIIGAALTLPIIFKEDIQKAFDQQMADNLNAKVYYDIDRFNLSLFTNFPDMTLSVGDFGIVGIAPFDKDTLTSIQSFAVTIDLASLFGDEIVIEQVLLDRPAINVKVLKDGSANYDIAKEASEETETAENDTVEASPDEEGGVGIAIKEWKIANADILYDDQSSEMLLRVSDLTHTGSGDFSKSIFDMQSTTTVASTEFIYDSIAYISDKSLFADITLSMDLDQMIFTFKENKIKVNEFGMGIQGFIKMPTDDIEMNIQFGGQDITLTSILSLIPGIYKEYLAGVDATASVSFDGSVVGTYNETSMPAVAASLEVKDGRIAYEDYPPVEKLKINSSFSYPSADLTETSFDINDFSFELANQKVNAFLHFKDLENYKWDFGLDGSVDLNKLTAIIPLEGMKLAGIIQTDINTKGEMATIEAEKYDELKAEGTLSISEFSFSSSDLPAPFQIDAAQLSITPKTINLSEFDSKFGNSDFALTGNIENYIGYALDENQTLTGLMTLNSSLLDLDQLMAEDSTVVEIDTTNSETPLEVVGIPEGIDFKFQATIDQMKYSGLNMKDFQGAVLVKDQSVLLQNNSFNMLGGTFRMNGSYDTKNLSAPAYTFDFGIANLSIGNAFQSFTSIQKFIPVAEQVEGSFSTDFKVKGLLGTDMMPILDAIDLEGLVNIAEASLNEGTFVNKLSALNSLKPLLGKSAKNSALVSLKDVLINAQIKNGKLFIEPFDLKIAGQNSTIGGNNGLDGSLDYSMLVKEVSTGAIGAAVNNLIGSLGGGSGAIAEKVDLNFGIGGSVTDPQLKLLGTSGAGTNSSAASSFKSQVSQKVDEQKEKAKEELEQKKAELEAKAKAELEKQKQAAADSLAAIKAAAKKKAEEEAKKKLKGLFKKGGNE